MRIKEAYKQGFKKAIVPKGNVAKNPPESMEIFVVSRLSEVLAFFADG